MPPKRPSLVDISAAAGVSRTTVSLVLNGKAAEHRIADATVARVRSVAEELGYAPNHAARSLRTRRSGVVGLVIPDLTNHFAASLARALEHCAAEAGYQLWIADSEDRGEREAELLSGMQDRQVEGLLVASSRGTAARTGCPVVHVDRRVRGGRDWVSSDNAAATEQLIASLCERGVFDGEAAWIGGLSTSSTNKQRRHGFASAMAAAGFKVDDLPMLERDWSPAWGYAAMERLSQDRPRPVCCASFTLMQGVLDWWHEHGPIDPAWRYACFDDHPLLAHLAIPISAVQQDHEALAAAAFTLLHQRITGAEPERHGITVPARLRIRHS